ncbi:MAG TPA: universal stress protein [Solirubrobacteraceae bacterium]|jgi:nucleotide-binding universal stress UspA family protein|nr:universal stress protein [Solirubrobacteraceae bacterium]
MSFRRVIVAFDGSPQAEDALALALRLRDPDDGALALACVVPGGRWHVGAHSHRPDAAVPEEIESLFADACARLIPPGIHVRRRAPIAPSPARGLTELAESEDADLVVIGSSRHGEPGRIRLERTAGRLLQGAPCAVAVAPGGLRSAGPAHHIGIAYDGSPEAEAALHAGYDIAAASGAAVTLFHAIPTGGLEPLSHDARLRAQERLDAAADAAPPGVNPATALLFGAPAEVIRKSSDGIVDLLVAGSRGYGPMQRALVGSVSELLVEGAPQPVLVLPRRPRSGLPLKPVAIDQQEAR